MRIVAAAAVAACTCAVPAAAQEYDGYVSTLVSVMPDIGGEEGRRPVTELRARVFAEGLFDPHERLHVRIGAFADGLAADREHLGGAGATTAAILRPADVYAEYRGRRVEVRAGIARVVWGRLDEFQPTDVVNPLDLSRFVFEGRSEARLPVSMVRARAFLPGGSVLEALVVPAFRPGTFDQLDEKTSPFRLAPLGVVHRHEPGVSAGNLQGGARFTSTLGRVDWSVSAWRGFEAFPVYVPRPIDPDPLALVVPVYDAVFPRVAMVGADFETVSGPWGVRGEAAFFDGQTVRSFEGGIGADRRAGDYRIALNALVSRADDTDLTFVAWAERTFTQGTRAVRLLAVYDPVDRSTFIRGVGAVSLRDNLWLEATAGLFESAEPSRGGGTGDVLSLLERRDFLYVRLKFHF